MIFKPSMWQRCECQQVVDSRLVVQRCRKLANQKPSVIVVRRKGRLIVPQVGLLLCRVHCMFHEMPLSAYTALAFVFGFILIN